MHRNSTRLFHYWNLSLQIRAFTEVHNSTRYSVLLNIPDIDGIELCQIVRNDPDFYSLPIIFIIDELQADISALLYKKGADDCIIAPIKEAELITRIFNRFRVNRLP